MIKTELLQGGKLIRHYSDQPFTGLLQEDTGIVYREAIDPSPSTHTYKEVQIEASEEERELEEAKAALRILGVQI